METAKNSSPAASSLLKYLIPGSSMEEEEEWLSIYVEDCLSSATSYTNFNPIPTPFPSSTPPQTLTPKPSFKNHPAVPDKVRTKRRRIITPRNLSTFDLSSSDPPLLHQTHWLAESELIRPKRDESEEEEEEEEEEVKREQLEEGGNPAVQQPRKCTHCSSQRTPQWRAGPLGPKTLCNACGVRFKSGRLLPEYRPAKSPTYVSYKHSNSHKKVMMMRMALLPSNSK